MSDGSPVLDSRDVSALLQEISARVPAYLPEWRAGTTGLGAVLQQVLARDLRVLSERLNQAPVKNEMAFLDLLGLDTIAAQGARAPVVFQARSQVPDGHVPAGSQVAARPAGGGEQITFETEQAIALAAAKLTDVVSVWPGRDAFADHSPRIAQGEPVTLFEPLKAVPHEFYLAHHTHLALAGMSTVEVQFDLATPGSEVVELAWDYWDGEAWRSFKDATDLDTDGESFDGTAGLTRSGVVRLVADCAEAKALTLQGITSYWIRARSILPLPPTQARRPAQVERVRILTSITKKRLELDNAYSDQLKLDLTNAFQPLGAAPRAGSTWYLSSKEAFSKPGAAIWLSASDVAVPEGAKGSPTLALEIWDGQRWQGTGAASSTIETFVQKGGAEKPEDKRLAAVVPAQTGLATVNGEESCWARIRMTGGAFTHETTVSGFTVSEYRPPMLSNVFIDYTYTLGTREFPTACLTYDDFQWTDYSEEVHGVGRPFEVFVPIEDLTPTLYLGFDGPLPADLIGLYFHLEPTAIGVRNPTLRWDYWDGEAWRDLTVVDETADFALPGMVNVLWPGTPPVPKAQVLQADGTTVQLMGPAQVRPFRAGDVVYIEKDGKGEMATVADAAGLEVGLTKPLAKQVTQATMGIASLARFGTPRSWMRARLDTDGEPAKPRTLGVHANAVWAVQARTIRDELIGTSTGQAKQVFFFREHPVLRGETVEVRELSGPRAAVELPMLLGELEKTGLSANDVRLVSDRRTGKVNEVWVRWRARPNLFFSAPEDRHYVVERTRGRLLFGDGKRGRIPPPGADNVLAKSYRSGGGQAGNVPARAITELLSGVLAEGVTNPRAAEGGADAQPTADVLRTGPDATRHRIQAVSAADFEALAREASPAVAFARALPTTHPSGRRAPGWVTIVVVPHSTEPRPELSFGLRRQVEEFLAHRVPAQIGARIAVVGPTYLPIGIDAILAPVNLGNAGPVHDTVTAALEAFLHPLKGGPDGTGWGFGRDVHLSDIASLIEGLAGVDFVRGLELLVDESPQDEVVEVPPERIVVAGPLRISLVGKEV